MKLFVRLRPLAKRKINGESTPTADSKMFFSPLSSKW